MFETIIVFGLGCFAGAFTMYLICRKAINKAYRTGFNKGADILKHYQKWK